MNEQHISTSILQSRTLLKAGLDPSTADMYWILGTDVGSLIYGSKIDMTVPYPIQSVRQAVLGQPDYYVPAWSLGKLWEIAKKTYPSCRPASVCCQADLADLLTSQVSAYLQLNKHDCK